MIPHGYRGRWVGEDGRTCEECRFFQEVAGLDEGGECRYNPPIAGQAAHNQGTARSARWPVVNLWDFCGSFSDWEPAAQPEPAAAVDPA